MPLKDVSTNRCRGWSLDSFESADDCIALPQTHGRRAERQSRSTVLDAQPQLDDGFARFLQQHSSPTHQRVTAGGHIVPMQQTQPPPPFNLPTETSPRKKNRDRHRSSEDSRSRMKGSKSGSGNQSFDKHKEYQGSAAPLRLQRSDLAFAQKPKNAGSGNLNTADGFLQPSDFLPRPIDLGRSGTHSDPSFVLQPCGRAYEFPAQSLVAGQICPGVSASGAVLDANGNMMVANGDQVSTAHNPLFLNPAIPTINRPGQVAYMASQPGDLQRLAQTQLQQSAWPSWAGPVPFNHVSAEFVPYQSNVASLYSAAPAGTMYGSASQSDMTPQSATVHNEREGQGTTYEGIYQHRQASNSAATQRNTNLHRKVIDQNIKGADKKFLDLDAKLQGLDRYTASHHSSFDAQTKSYYVAERMKLVEQRDMARRELTHLRTQRDQKHLDFGTGAATFAAKNGGKQDKSSEAAVHDQSATTQFNAQAADWFPQGFGQNLEFADPPHSTAPYIGGLGPAKPHNMITTDQTMMAPANSFTGQINTLSGMPCMPPTSYILPGPYTRQLCGIPGGEVPDFEIDEWGLRRGPAPAHLVQRQNKEAMKLHKPNIESTASAGGQLQAGEVSATNNSGVGAQATDEWGVRTGHAPAETSQQQYKQHQTLASMTREQRSQISMEALNDASAENALDSGTASFANVAQKSTDHPGANDTPTIPSVTQDGFSSVTRVSGPSTADWEAIVQASQKVVGEKTNLTLTSGHSITVEGQSEPEAASRTGDTKTQHPECRDQQRSAGDEGWSLGKPPPVQRVDDIGLLVRDGRKHMGSILSSRASQEENDFFRHKGSSSVALQSVTAQGMLPGAGSTQGSHGERGAGIHPAQSPSPTKRALRNLWAHRQRQAPFTTVEEEQERNTFV